MVEERKRLKLKTFDLILIGFGVLFLFSIFYVVHTLKDEGLMCANSPLVYATKKLSETNNEQVTCACSYPGSPTLISNASGLTLIGTQRYASNYSNIPILNLTIAR